MAGPPESTSPKPQLRGVRGHPLALLITLALFAGLTAAAFHGVEIYEEYEHTRHAAGEELRDRAILLAQQAETRLETIDQIVAAAVFRLSRSAAMTETQSELFERGVAFAPDLFALAHYDREGRYQGGYSRDGQHRNDCSDCRFFRVHRTEGQDHFLGLAFDDESGRDPRLGISRRVVDAQGHMVGAVVGIVDAERFRHRLIERMGEKIDRAALFDRAGVALVTWRRNDARPGPDLLSQTARRLAPLGPETSSLRLDPTEGAFASLAPYPLWIGTALDHSRFFASWRSTAQTNLMLLVGVLAVLAILTGLGGRQIRIRRHAEQALRDAVASQDAAINAVNDKLRQESAKRILVDTALKESEMRFHHFMDNLPIGAYIKRPDGRYLYANRRFSEVCELGDQPVRDRTAYDLFSESIAMTTTAIDREVLSQRKAISRNVTFRQGERTRHFVACKFPIPLADGSLVIGGATIDTTEQQQALQALHQAQKMEAMGHLTGGIAHDFNNLLTVILGNMEMLIDELGEMPDLAHHANEARLAAKRGRALTQRLLGMFRRRPGSPDDHCEVNGLVASMSDLLRRTLGDAIEVRISVLPRAILVPMEAGLLESVLINLAINARDAMPEGGRLDIAVREPPAQAASDKMPPVLITVADSGQGMAPEIARRAFDPFFTTKSGERGSGLGLTMVHSAVNQAGGDAILESDLGKGTVITLKLPRLEGRAVGLENGLGDAEARFGGRGERILVVEDEPEVRRVAMTMLARLGYQVESVDTGVEALNRLRTTDPAIDLVFSDIVMRGGLDGLALADAIAKDWPGLPVLLASGHSDRLDRMVGERPPVLAKPYDRATLARRVRERLDQVRATAKT